MRFTERFLIIGLSVSTLVLAAHSAGLIPAGSRALAAPAMAEPAPAKIATCDISELVQRVFETAPYFTPRQQEFQRQQAPLTPLETAMKQLHDELDGADLRKPENAAKMKEGEAKAEEYKKLAKQANDSYLQFLSDQYTDAYRTVHTAATKLAKERGFTHLIATRAGAFRHTSDVRSFSEEVSARPMVMQPDGTDITEELRAQLKLQDRPVSDSPLLSKPGEPRPADGR